MLTLECPTGHYVLNGHCVIVLAGYYKPVVPYSNAIYICPAGKYSIGGAIACSYCSLLSPTSALVGATMCSAPVYCGPGTLVENNECSLTPIG